MKTTALRFCILAVLTLVCLPVMAQYTGTNGLGSAFDKRQPTIAVNFIICINGNYPINPGGTPALGAVNLTAPLIGEIRAVSFASPIPTNFMLCDGQLLSVSVSSSLFSILGYQYGTEGTATFALPNLGGTTPIGSGQAPGLPAYSLAETAGLEEESLTESNSPAHIHSTPHGYTGSTGSGAPFNNMQPSIAINFDICTNGQIMMFAGNYSPQGWVPCDGSLYSISDQPTLYGYIGTNYGGDGITTFAVPDLRGRAPIGSGQSPGLSLYATAQQSGSLNQTLTYNQLPIHQHSLPGGGNTGSAGGGLPFDSRQPTLGLGWYVCLIGSLPTTGDTFPMVGELRLFAGSTSPVPNFTLAKGQTVSIFANEALYGVIGTTYGGNGTTTFSLPGLSSRLAVGAGQSFGTSNYNVGNTAGAENLTLTTAQMPAHAHALPGIIQVRTSSGTILTNGATLSCSNTPTGASSLDSLVITNIGGLNLALSNAAFSGGNSGDFSLNPSLAGTSLAAESSLPANLQFAPAAAGTRTAELSITNADLANNPFVLYLTGIGVPVLTGANLANGSFAFSFTANPTNQYTVLTATNLSLPLSNWTVIGSPTNTSGNNFTFGAAATAGQSQQFYRVLAQ